MNQHLSVKASAVSSQYKLFVLEKQKVIFEDLGMIPYKEAWDYQEKLVKQDLEIKSSLRKMEIASTPANTHHEYENLKTKDYLLFCEHPAVYTLGNSGQQTNLLIGKQKMAEKGIEFVHTNRGGDITFHGPQQIVGYPILDLEHYFTDIGKYIHYLEEVIISMLETYGIKGERSKGQVGVWIEPGQPAKARKICAMGIRCSRWITMHGFALNVNTDLSFFDHIIPCGIANKQVASMEKELGRDIPIEEVKEKLKKLFADIFDFELI